jgi:hypothetical protein
MKNSGNRSQNIKVKFPWIKELNSKTKENVRRRRRRKINKIKENIEKLSYREVLIIDHMIQKMIKTPSTEYEYENDDKYKNERRY